MENYLLTGLGIFTSIILFLVGYRQTIGAKQERSRIANEEIEKILIRRIVIENFEFNIIDISRLIEGKARDFKVKTSDLLSENQVLNCIYTRIVETDLITQKQREEVLGKIIPIIDTEESLDTNEESKVQKYKQNKIKTQLFVTISIALTASAIGALMTTFLSYDSLTSDINNIFTVLIPTASISLAFISFISILKKFKESQQEVSISSKSLAVENGINFEKEVAKALQAKFNNVQVSDRSDKGYDFSVISEDRKILIEVKSWVNPVSKRIIEVVVNKLDESILDENASEGIIVIKNPFDYNIDLNKSKIKIMSLNELKETF